MNLTSRTRMGLSSRFHVAVDGIQLGGWSSCKGLAVEFENEIVHVGGSYDESWVLPTRLKYSNVTLTRAITADGTKAVQAWLRQMQQEWLNSEDDGDRGGTATITLMDTAGDLSKPAFQWTLRNVYPKSWKGPDMDATSGNVALEQLELIHQGFL
ncbi:phage tail protein [Streptomyces sp. WAC06614]|uniref:phage tail protein n=1 Tax=Streptomyces sp. WAC06614 TaxID=2487416 RepID=UPI000F769314|nr:phage tail protein [Streptomyces sp. WAC06614]RSS67423.1 phage tail protein [Streptomyces sp. WAC06614]